MNESDPRCNVHYLSSTESKAWKKIQACTGSEPMTCKLSQLNQIILYLHNSFYCQFKPFQKS